jgi:ATP adenylyltransferase
MEILWAPWRMTYIAGETGTSPPAPEQPPATPGAAAGENQPSPTPNPQPPTPATGCIFCDKAAAGEAADRDNLILWRGAHTFAILNLYPYNSGHLMVVPYRHLAAVTMLTAAEYGELFAGLQRLVRVLDAVYRPDGYNVGMNLGRVAGAGIADHVHLHLVPRWSGDTNFMPVTGGTKVLPESLDQTWTRLREGMSDEE